MGYKRVEFTVTASVSRHNSWQDKKHDELWEEVIEKIEKILSDPKYRDINPMSF